MSRRSFATSATTSTTPTAPEAARTPTSLEEITLERLGEALVDTLERCAEPATVVGHSLEGLALTSAVEQRPELIRRLVYLAAVMLPNGAAMAAHAPMSEALREGTLLLDGRTARSPSTPRGRPPASATPATDRTSPTPSPDSPT